MYPLDKVVSKRIVVLPGDGTGPEVCGEAVRVLKAVAERFGHHFVFEYHLLGAEALEATGRSLPAATLDACHQADAVLLGPIGDARHDHNAADTHPEQALRALHQSLGSYGSMRPVTAHAQLLAHSPLRPDHVAGTDILIVQERSRGEDASDPAVMERMARRAFRAARARRRQLTLVDNPNGLEASSRWREVVQELAGGYPDVAVSYLLAQDAAMQLLRNPRQFDVILADSLVGDMLTGEAAVMTGTQGLLPSASVGDGVALFEPLHGPNPQARGRGTADPLAAVLAAALMLDYFALPDEARAVRAAVAHALHEEVLTPDLNATTPYTTEQVGGFIAYGVLDLMDCYLHRSNVAYGKSTII
ncbi:3-isopropylmalate dehydrogenase [Hymenobacter sp. BT683]|uniref:3-isopropylmalate dehydrogenase n=1 Tax=Hymenobacter jeongseonensis TaxID=2791027 RepID=A0ABS0IIS7_9BACT|nr:isocitrate/isopropylmalate family dehydrogenase [Hymenobacter jeongseonensis]MBF9238277.1 3-isopropylmalate dehydrogenase [Hymenobacter jeongseonensis]